MGEVLLGVVVCQSQSSVLVVRPKVGFRSLRKTHNNSLSRSTIRCSTPTQLSKSRSSCGFGGVSQKSLLAGGISASLLYYVYSQLPVRPVLASSVGLGISAALLGVMGARFKKSGKIFPAGVVSLVSLIMTGGYLHGIMRSLH
ncbi:protein fatty acid export 2 [Quercus suber]|uniref:Protein fatty acid export 2 n=1 Tax=Quercus suber TaxID=58331 RepID=A0AAW0KTG1_QUESU